KNRVARTAAEQEPAIRLHEETRIVGDCDRIVAANVVERAELLRDYDASASRIATIPCGVDTDLFVPGDRAEARARLALDERPMLLWVGRVAPIKGLDTLLDAVARLRVSGRAARLLIVGGVTGFLVPDGDVEALAERIGALVGDPDLRWRVGREGVRWAAQHRWACVAEAVCKEYASLESRAGAHLASGRCRD